MMSAFKSAQRRFGNARPGMQLLAVEAAALPVTMLRADVLAQERRQIPVTEEFFIRFVRLGVDAPEKVAAYLGLDSAHILDAAAAQVMDGSMRRLSDGRVELTTAGLDKARQLSVMHPVSQQLPVAFDRLTWALAGYRERDLIDKSAVTDLGMLVLPAPRNASISLDDLSAAAMNSLLKDSRLQVLRIDRVESRRHRYLPVELLVYGNPGTKELELAICVDDELSSAHSLALEKISAVGRLGLTFHGAPRRPRLDDEVEEARARHIAADHGPGAERSPTVEAVVGSEHLDLLDLALSSATTRIAIRSAAIQDAVVDNGFVAKLAARLRAGAQVTIVVPPGIEGSAKHGAERDLQRLADQHKNFRFVRATIQGSPELLIFDDTWVCSEFRWLHHRTQQTRSYRIDEGTVIRTRDRVDIEYRRLMTSRGLV